MDVQLPDGTVLKGVPDGTTKAQIAAKLEDGGHSVPKDWLAPKEEGYSEKVERTGKAFDKAAGTGLKGFGNTLAAALDIGASSFTGLAGDIAGAATSIATQDPKKGASVRKAMTYEPDTEAGKAAMNYVGAITSPVGRIIEAGPKSLEEHGHPIAAQGVRAAIDVVGMKGLKGGGKAADVGEAVKEAPTINSEMVAKARANGYVLKPSEAGGKIGKAAEGLAGSPKLSVEASLKNQKVTNRLAAKEVGLPDGARVTRGTLAKVKQPHNKVYEEMANLGEVQTTPEYQKAIQGIGRAPGNSFSGAVDPAIDKLKQDYAVPKFDAKDAVLEVRKLRAASAKNIKAPNAPAQNELGYAQRQVADAIESQMEQHAAAMGKSDLVNRLKVARQNLAKIHAVESALVGNSGDVSAQALAKQAQRGVPLSGRLKTIADVATEFGEVTRDATKLKNKVPVTVLEGAVGAGAVGLGHPGALAGIIARPATRSFLLSDLYQSTLGKGPVKPHEIPTLEDLMKGEK